MIGFSETSKRQLTIDGNMIKLGNKNQIYLDDGVWVLEMYEGTNEYKGTGEELFSVYDGFENLEDAVKTGLILSPATYNFCRTALQYGKKPAGTCQ